MDIICGPMVRDTNRQQFCLWFVAKSAYDDVEVIARASQTGQKVSQATEQQRLQLATHCYCYLLTVHLQLPEDIQQINYDLKINGAGIAENGLQQQICYPGEDLPSIVIPQQHQHFLQSSCRKPHDVEGIDQLQQASELVKNQLNSVQRPSQLVMTGDQIYADDVSPIMLDLLQQLQLELGFFDERLPAAEGDFSPRDLELDTRGNVLKPEHGFTSSHKDCHLMSFADYFCMYILAFAGYPGDLQADIKTDSQLEPKLSLWKRITDRLSSLLPFKESEYQQHLHGIQNYLTVAGDQVRKLFAHTPSYMIFDDHEVTDDWNLTDKHANDLEYSKLGRHIYINALSAYAICQHWGNTSNALDNFCLEHLHKLSMQNDIHARTALANLIKKDWSYVVRQEPPLIVLDTRTDRLYHGLDNQRLALMSPARLMQLTKELQQLPISRAAILVSPTPMFGFSSIEAAQLRLSSALKSFADVEPWVADEFALQSLQQTLLQIPGLRDVFIFSGDVHYAFLRRQQLSPPQTNFWQITSSASCNTPVGGHKGLDALQGVYRLFTKKRTPYLKPTNDSEDFFTTHKNIASLSLGDKLEPKMVVLHCCKLEQGQPQQFVMEYDLSKTQPFKGSGLS